MNTTYNIPVWEKYTLSIEEAAYFRIGCIFRSNGKIIPLETG